MSALLEERTGITSVHYSRTEEIGMRAACLFDIDGTLTAPAGGMKPDDPHPLLGPALQALDTRYLMVAITGAGDERVRITEEKMGYRFRRRYTSYGNRLVYRDGREEFLASCAELEALRSIKSLLNDIKLEYDASQTDEGACYSMHLPCDSTVEDFNAACAEIRVLKLEERGLGLKSTEHDRGLVIVPLDVVRRGKQRAVDHIISDGYEIALGVGDTATDLSLLKRARSRIVTRTYMDADIDPVLAQLVADDHSSYVARRNEPHGLGVISGLRFLLERQVIVL